MFCFEAPIHFVNLVMHFLCVPGKSGKLSFIFTQQRPHWWVVKKHLRHVQQDASGQVGKHVSQNILR